MIYDWSEAALCGAGADNANNPPSEVLRPDHERSPAVPGAGGLLAVAVPGTQLVRAGHTRPGLLLALRLGQHGHRDRLEGAGVRGPLLHPQPPPPGDGGLGAGLQEQRGLRQTHRPDVTARLDLERRNIKLDMSVV